MVKVSLPCTHQGAHVSVQGTPQHSLNVHHQQHPHVKLYQALHLLPAVHHPIHGSELAGIFSGNILESNLLLSRVLSYSTSMEKQYKVTKTLLNRMLSTGKFSFSLIQLMPLKEDSRRARDATY